MAGLRVLRSMPEPTAVALLYAQQQQQAVHESRGSGSEKNALIFNMGAGYCDVAVTVTASRVSHIKALAGITFGGEDILQNIMHYILPEMDNLFSSHGIEEIRKIGLLHIATQDAIHKLSFQPSVQIDVDLGNGTKICKVLDRNEFEAVNQKVFEKSLEGAVASGINDPFGSLDLLTIQATTLSSGIRADGNNFVPLVLHNSTIPARRELVFTTVHDNQAEALIIVLDILISQDYLLLQKHPATPFMEVRMPTVDDGRGWCAEALHRTYGSTLDLITVQKKVQQ
ncbi:hypothetical protein ACH5RR_033282 [Cinchona calisaya]|uniref:Heat shock protein 70 n=1 Tax=Cinchona calisaya TaxID=153742 RepID=A0ABD2YP26_9GENT